MSFRLRIFLLVLIVAGTAIGATAWLTLSLTSREVDRLNDARQQHEAEITDEIRQFGLTNGRWNGINRVVADLSERTGLHIRVETDEEVLTDSDRLREQAVGPIQTSYTTVDPYPELDPEIARQASALTSTAAQDPDGRRLADLYRKTPKGTLPSGPVPPRPRLPANLFAVSAATAGLTTPEAAAFLQVAQYRAALVAVRCGFQRHLLPQPAMGSVTSPYLTPPQLTAAQECAEAGRAKVYADLGWLNQWWESIARCRVQPMVLFKECLPYEVAQAMSSTGAVPVRVFFGAGQLDRGVLRQPAVIGAAGLLLAAAIGTAWIARRISRPVRALTGASLQLAAGKLDVRVQTRGKDELAFLSSSFNAMAEAIQRSEERQRRLVADVAHELRTPLSNLRGYLEGLADGVIEPAPELFASLHEETLLTGRILDDLQYLALAEAGDLAYHPEPLDLSELADTAVTAHRANAANAGLDLVIDAPEPIEVHADPGRIRQVLGNLLSNAIRYTDAGGRIEVRVSRDPLTAILSVTDTGVGMTAAEVSRVFDRFWRADPARQRATGGSGLGLTITRRIVEDHGGSVNATSEPGLGSTFTVRLPASMR
ncbi:two-component sensor histidine kinase [Actinoplanes cyaneus]|uniref:histidine kinase n=1 Tax=Actinoplanes cyaneus TaxID=52696 RepID=A0A919IFK7_9ACTN|nr:ATP-binding protein [Actinoplanes cyaneus]MCW2136098.1 two-component system, OmpR family, sensor histidine kinase BaeS [Actinoplanes cyaneus]GID62533.1 two-component sensor histidine kinase [Actinoplanes cyaneus]